jgi:hypothetical protein
MEPMASLRRLMDEPHGKLMMADLDEIKRGSECHNPIQRKSSED